MIRLSQPELGHRDEELVLDVMRSGRLAQGPMVERLERSFSEFLGGGCTSVAVANGTVALEVALRAAGIGPGDEVITSPLTFVATLNAILAVGATARFADVDEYFVMNPDSAEALVGPQTKALLPVHLYGLPADMDALTKLADRYGLAVIEDSAQAHGARVGGRAVGTFGIGTFSLYATKNLMAGEGGLITTTDADTDALLRLLRNQGMRERYRYEVVGTNARLTDLHAAIAVAQLESLPARNAARQEHAAVLIDALADLDGLLLPGAPAGRDHVWHQFTVRVTPEAPLSRSDLAAALAAHGIESGIYYPALVHAAECFADHPLVGTDDTVLAGRVVDEVLSLPIHPYLADADLAHIATTIRGLWS